MIVILIGKSGSGKSHLQKELMRTGNFASTVSHTTRKPRDGEVDGVDYHFITKTSFMEMVENNEFVNYDLGSMCSGRDYYGTHFDELDVERDKPVLMVLSPTGAKDILEKYYESIGIHLYVSEGERILRMLERPTMSKQDVIDRLKVEGAEYDKKVISLVSHYLVYERMNRYTEESLKENVELITILANSIVNGGK